MRISHCLLNPCFKLILYYAFYSNAGLVLNELNVGHNT